MNHWTNITDPTAPWNERESNDRTRCTCGCDRFVDDLDPCKIDGRLFADICASNLTTLRMEGFINVASKTKKLK